MLEFTDPCNNIVVNIVVILNDIRAGIADGLMKKQHQDNSTNTTAGTNIDETKCSRRLRKKKKAVSLA